MRSLVTAGKNVNNIRAIARQPTITTIEGLLEAVFSVVFAPRLYEDPKPAECSKKKVQPLPFYQRRNNERRKRKTKALTWNKYMAMGFIGARCQG
jgi:hypothetical protein